MNYTIVKDWERAARLFVAGHFDAARAVLESMLAREPGNAEAWLALVQVDIHTGKVRLAAEHALAAAKLGTDSAKTLCDLAGALLTIGEVSVARECLRRAARDAPGEAALQQSIGLQYQNLGMHDEALAWLERSCAAGLDDAASRFYRAVQLTFHGRMAEAEALLETCADVNPPFGRAMAQLSQLRKQTPDRNHLRVLERQLAEVDAGTEDHAALEFARYKEFEDLGQYEDAWQSLRRANDLMHALLRHDSVAEQRTFGRLAEYVRALPALPSGPARGPIPIFIIGLPRSGTTLLDRLLGNHSEVHSAGELGTFRRCLERVADRFTGPMLDEAFVEKLSGMDYAEVGELYLANSQWRANGRRFYIDKMPRNWLLAPLIHASIPEARILHITREPTAVAFSNYRSYFGHDYPYCYSEDSLVRHYVQYRRLMRDWHTILPGAVLDVSYDALVSNPDAELNRIFEFCGLEWQAGCVDLARNTAPVATLSAVQVRGAISAGMSDRWRNYERHLAGMREGMDAAER